MRTILDCTLLDPDTGLEAGMMLALVDLKGMRTSLRPDGHAADGTVPVFTEGTDALGAGDDNGGHEISSYSCGLALCSS